MSKVMAAASAIGAGALLRSHYLRWRATSPEHDGPLAGDELCWAWR